MALCGGRDCDRVSIEDTRPTGDCNPVMNLTDEPRTLYRGTRMGEAHVITKCDNVEGMLPVTLFTFLSGGTG